MNIEYKNHNFSSYLDLSFHLVDTLGEDINPALYIPEDKYFYITYLLKEKFPNQEFAIASVQKLLAEELALNHITQE